MSVWCEPEPHTLRDRIERSYRNRPPPPWGFPHDLSMRFEAALCDEQYRVEWWVHRGGIVFTRWESVYSAHDGIT